MEEELRELISRERLAPYVTAVGGDLGRAFNLYAWNIEASGAFQGPLGQLEVITRNAIDKQLVKHVGRRDWWFWRGLGLNNPALEKVEKARRKLRKNGKSPSSADMLPELMLGFWVSLLGTNRNNYETRIWRPALRMAFPSFEGSRADLHRDFDNLRVLRNRISHQEPIYGRDLAKDYETLLILLSWILPETAEWVGDHSRVLDVLACREDVCAGKRKTRF